MGCRGLIVIHKERRNYGGRASISSEIHIYLFLWFTGNKSTLREVGQLFNVSEFSALLISERVMNFLRSIGKDIIKFPLTDEEKASVSAGFESISGFPNVIGCIDGLYINIRTPNHKIRNTYTNRHHQTAITMQGICDGMTRATDVIQASCTDSPSEGIPVSLDRQSNRLPAW